jgi:dienelactone hydrolase
MSSHTIINDIELPLRIDVGGLRLDADLVIPHDARGIVLFAHGSGSSRFSPRNRFVAERLQQTGLATVLMDLLTEEEEKVDIRTRQFRFDIDRLARRLHGATEWLREQRDTKELNVGYFGASTGAAAALIAASELPETVRAVVSRGGRPDLAGGALPRVRAATLLIVGGEDFEVIELNREALERMSSERRLEIVPHATHLFEEPGTLETVADLAAGWFRRHLDGTS